MIKISFKKKLQEITDKKLNIINKTVNQEYFHNFNNFFGDEVTLRKSYGTIEVDMTTKTHILHLTFPARMLEIFEFCNMKLDYEKNLIFSEKYKNGIRISYLLSKATEFERNYLSPKNEEIEKILNNKKIPISKENIKKEISEYKLKNLNLLYKLFETNKENNIEDAVKKNIEILVTGRLFESTFIDFKKALTELGDGPYHLIFSRHPVDVIRMADHEKTQSCHSPEGSLFKCAVQESRGHGFVVYLLREKDFQKVQELIPTRKEIFKDEDRGISGIEPVGRARIRKFILKTPSGTYTIGAPERSLYGLENLNDKIIDEVIYICKKIQKKEIQEINSFGPDKIRVTAFTSYFDTDVRNTLADLGISTNESYSYYTDEENLNFNFYEIEDLIKRKIEGFLSYSENKIYFQIDLNLLKIILEDSFSPDKIKKSQLKHIIKIVNNTLNELTNSDFFYRNEYFYKLSYVRKKFDYIFEIIFDYDELANRANREMEQIEFILFIKNELESIKKELKEKISETIEEFGFDDFDEHPSYNNLRKIGEFEAKREREIDAILASFAQEPEEEYKIQRENKKLNEVQSKYLYLTQRQLRNERMYNFDNFFGEDYRKFYGTIEFENFDKTASIVLGFELTSLFRNSKITVDYNKNLLFSKKYKNGIKITSFLLKANEFLQKVHETRLDELDDEYEKYKKLLYNLFITNENSELDKIIKQSLLTKNKDFFLIIFKAFQKFLSEVGDGPYCLIFSRHPIDVLRMSDHKKISSCHGVGKDEFGCAIQESKGHGFVVYVVRVRDYEKIKDILPTKREIFSDPDRNVDGIEPLARIRVRKFGALLNGDSHSETEDGMITIGIPELVYGLESYNSEIYSKVFKICKTIQKKEIYEINSNPNTEIVPYTTYHDIEPEQLIKNIGIKKGIISDFPYKQEESYVSNEQLQKRIKHKDYFFSSNNEDFVFMIKIELKNFVDNNLISFEELKENIPKLNDSLHDSWFLSYLIYPSEARNYMNVASCYINDNTDEIYCFIYLNLDEMMQNFHEHQEIFQTSDIVEEIEATLIEINKRLQSKVSSEIKNYSKKNKGISKEDELETFFSDDWEPEIEPIFRESLYGYDKSKEKFNVNASISDVCNNDDKVQTIINVYNLADEETKNFFSNWYKIAGSVCDQIAEKYLIDSNIVKAIMAVLSPGNKFEVNIKSCEDLIRNFLFGENNIVRTVNKRNATKATEILRTGNLDLVTGPKVQIFYKTLLDPSEIKKEIVLDGHAISIWLGKRIPLKSNELNISTNKRKIIKDDYIKASKCLNIEPHVLQAVTWAVWKNIKATEVITKHD